ncbi:aspartyl-phosphate phosphatase Spo0E family protein [Priestia megaterium]|uniref:aspartyl-phosphate phosphatase Spo0E family protein n=1 Tax=Priestia megaterium TaxID=1404 RepID=UPI002E1C9BA9|nr:aspartyl-phosphate phosphatase Spo0E family protein [Priestia megaterium]
MCLKCRLLLIKIEFIRKMMMMIALEEGFTSSNTIKISQDLDVLLNRFEATC